MAKKPTGQTGSLRVTVTENGIVRTFEKIEFPKEKSEIEMLIADRYFEWARKMGAKILSFEQNDENSFDFTFTTPKGKCFLELTEFIRPTEKGSPFAGTENVSLDIYEEAEILFNTIKSKIDKYPKNGKTHLELLVYSTHWSFFFNDTSIKIVQQWLLKSNDVFAGIFLFIPLDNTEGYVRFLYPMDPIPDFDAEQFKGQKIYLFSPMQALANSNSDE